MISVDFLNASISRLAGMLLPFWARGRKMSMLVQSVLKPLETAHSGFKEWALEEYIAAHITAQKNSLEWYLKHLLQQHFVDTGDEFVIVQGSNELTSCFSTGYWLNEYYWSNELEWQNEPESEAAESGGGDAFITTAGEITVYAPAIVASADYTANDYEREIRTIMSRYMVTFGKLNVSIRNRYATEEQT